MNSLTDIAYHLLIAITHNITIMPKLQATVPKGLAPGSLLRVRLPDGSEVNVSIPSGLEEGDELIFETDSMGEVTASALNSGSNNNNKSSSSSKKDSSSQKKSSKQAKKKNKKSSTTLTLNRVEEAPSFVTSFFETYNLLYDNILNILEGHPSPSRANYSSNDNEYVPLLDRDIATGADFCVALCVGIFIGLSIVMGFITGVLWVVPINAENTSHIEVRAP